MTPHRPWAGRGPSPRGAAALLIALGLLLSVTALARTVWVKARYATIRAGTSSRSERVERVGRGSKLHVLGDEGGFVRVRSSRGKEGYVPRRWVTTKPPQRGQRMAKLGRAARSDDTGGVSVTAGARGLAPQAEAWAGEQPGMQEAAAALKRLEARTPDHERIERFLEVARLGPWQGPAENKEAAP